MQLLLIRHGESQANSEGRLQGQFDSPLTGVGRAQARALAERLLSEAWRVGTIHSSDLRRAAETAEILASWLEARVVLDDRLREYDVGVLTGVVWRDVESLYPDIWHGFHHSREWVPIPGEEGNRVFRARLREALRTSDPVKRMGRQRWLSHTVAAWVPFWQSCWAWTLSDRPPSALGMLR
jgi:probable phosphoglycerate mutase